MSAAKKEINELLSSLAEKDLRQVRALVKALLRRPDEITEGELEEVRKGQEEFGRGDWVRWEDVRRRDL